MCECHGSYCFPKTQNVDETCPHCSPRKADKNNKKRPRFADVRLLSILIAFEIS